jgi:hypothetical protein
MTKTSIFTERLDLAEANIDADNRLIRNVVLIRAGKSMNKRRYPEPLLQASTGVFEGAPAFLDHPRKSGESRSQRDLTGQYTNVRYENGALRADRVFTRTQAGNDAFGIAQDVIEGRISPTVAGLSINASGTGKSVREADGDVFEVESIVRAITTSIDDVVMPAAGGSYTESASGDTLVEMLFEAMTYEEFLEARPDYTERLRKDFKRVRQDEALKSAEAEAQRAQDALQEAQETIAQLTAERDNALTQRGEAQRALAVEETLNAPKVKLPASWKVELREKMKDADPQTWVSLIEGYQRRAADAGFKPRVDVQGAGQQVSAAMTVQERVDPVVYARQRIAEASSPEDLKRIQESLT